MKKILFYAASLVAVATACNKINSEPAGDVDEPASGVKMIIETVTARQGTSTKATISNADASFAWTEGDHIAVHVSNGKYVYTSDEGASGAFDVATAKTSFKVAYPEGTSRDAFAVYPSTIVAKDAANYGQDGAPLDVTLPDSYTLAQVSGETSQGPMIATNTPDAGWDFYQLCGMLRLTVNGVPASAKRLEIDFGGKQVSGDFSIATPVVPNTSVIATSDDPAHDVIKITKDGTDSALGATSLVVNIPLPVGAYASITITAYDALEDGKAIFTAPRPFAYTASNQRAVRRTVSLPSSSTAFRGYEVSTGILKRDASTTPATYSLTSGEMVLTADADGKNEHYALPDGCNPFEPAVYYNNNASRGMYYNTWTTLQNELGADGDNIDAASTKLPSGWRFPTGSGNGVSGNPTDWGKILFGVPQSPIFVNGSNVGSSAHALVSVILESGNSYSVVAGTYYGLLLLRDGTTIPTGYLSKLGGKSYNDNVLTETQFNDLIKLGCLFVSSSGRYYSNKWNYLEDGYYWTSTNGDKTGEANRFQFYNGTGGEAKFVGYNKNHENVVKLVKPL